MFDNHNSERMNYKIVLTYVVIAEIIVNLKILFWHINFLTDVTKFIDYHPVTAAER